MYEDFSQGEGGGEGLFLARHGLIWWIYETA